MRILFALSLIITSGSFVQAQVPPSSSPTVVKISPSEILSNVAERKKTQPGITANELAAYANELLEARGFDYHFDVCDILSARDRKSTAPSLSKRYRASLTDGRKLWLNLDLSNPQDGLCRECWALVPSRKVTRSEMHLIAAGKIYRLRRTPSFYLDEAQLVDSSLKKVLRSWVLPFQTVPTGISADGAKLYLSPYADDFPEELILELSEDGRLVFRERAELELKESTWIQDFPKDPKNSYLSFIKFQVGNKSFIVRFSAPCT